MAKKVKENKSKKKYKAVVKILDLSGLSAEKIQKLFWKELYKKKLNEDNIKVFIESGVLDFNTKDKDGFTALYYLRKHPELAISIIELGASLENEIKPRKETNKDIVKAKCPACNRIGQFDDYFDDDIDSLEEVYFCNKCNESFSIFYKRYMSFKTIEQ